MATPIDEAKQLSHAAHPKLAAPPTTSVPESPIVALDGPYGRITVRTLEFSDAERMQCLADIEQMWINMRDTFPHPYTLDSAYSWISLSRSKDSWHATGPVDAQGKGTGKALPTSWAIAVNGELIGGLGIRFRSDVNKRTAEIGYWIGHEYWGKGITTRVTQAFLDWAWEQYPDIVRIDAGVHAWNKASQQVLKKLGFTHENTRKAAIFKDGKITDLEEFALVRLGTDIVVSHPALQ